MPKLEKNENALSPSIRTTYLISQAWFALRDRTDAALRKYGVTGMQYTLLTVLVNRKNLSSAQLSRRFHITPQAMGQVLNALEADGLLTRTEDPANRRVLQVNLTKAGQDVVKQCDAEMKRIEKDAFAGLDSSEIAALREKLHGIATRLREGSEAVLS